MSGPKLWNSSPATRPRHSSRSSCVSNTEIITMLGADKTALENRIEQLRAFEDDYELA